MLSSYHLFILLGLAWPSLSFDPYQPGPYPNTINFTKLNYQTSTYKNIDIYAPLNATGSFPVIYYSQSFAGTIPVQYTSTFLHHLASFGYTIVAPWRQLAPNYTVEWIDPTLDWLTANAKGEINLRGGELGYNPDFSRMVALGHSAGNHILVNYFKRKGCRDFKAAVLMSPVDGPLDFCITPGELLNYDMPTLVMMAGLDPIPGAPGFPACAPEDVSNTVFYDAMAGNKWFLNATLYGHSDFFNPGFQDLVDFLKFCKTDEETDKEVYIRALAGTCIAFFEGMLGTSGEEDSCRYIEQYVEQAEAEAPVQFTGFQEVNPDSKCLGYCNWNPEQMI